MTIANQRTNTRQTVPVVVKALVAPVPQSAAEIQAQIQALLQQARNQLAEIPECPELRDVKDGLRVIAAVCSVRIVVPRAPKPAKPSVAPKAAKCVVAPKLDLSSLMQQLAENMGTAPAAPLDMGEFLQRIEDLVMEASRLADRRLPERRDWIFQNGVKLFSDGMGRLRMTLAPPVRRTLAALTAQKSI